MVATSLQDEPWSKLLQRGYIGHSTGSSLGVTKGDTRTFNYSSSEVESGL